MFVASESHKGTSEIHVDIPTREKTNLREGREPGLVNRANKW